MAADECKGRWQTDGKFFRSGGTRVRMRAVTYGPFPGGWPNAFESDFRRMAEAGFNVVRVYEMPDQRLLDAAWDHGLQVFGGLEWGQNADFFRRPELLSAARVRLVEGLRESAGHPALVGVYVGNEVPADLVRWMGPVRVRRAIEELIGLGREVAPDLLFAYANYPSTEYLEPENADFSAFNVYLEDPEAFRDYLKRLHHIAGDRPLVVSEFGLDSRRNGLLRQAEMLSWAAEISREQEAAGFTVYAWSDRWWTGGGEVLDWDFGLTDREGNAKPALGALAEIPARPATPGFRFSVIICTRNGNGRIGRCLKAVAKLEGEYETLVVDDGSDDGTAEFVAENFPSVRLLRLDPSGLSAARNAGAAAASGEILAFTDDDCAPDREWLLRLARVFADGRFAAVGGPNLPPEPRTWHEAVVCAAPGAPSHVMLDDEEAEHLPGCNLAVTKAAFDAIGGFDPQFRTAGDDVDFCWRLRSAGFRLGFAPGAFVWHWRRPSIRGFLKQQIGYGRAERLLIAKHPGHFTENGGAKWLGFVYGGGAVRVMAGSIIYHGPMGMAGYQMVANRMLPLRGLAGRFDHWYSRLALRSERVLAPCVRSLARCGAGIQPSRWKWLGCAKGLLFGSAEWAHHRLLAAFIRRWLSRETPDSEDFVIDGMSQISREDFLARLLIDGWKPCGPTEDWDAVKNGTRILLTGELGKPGRTHLLVRIQGDVSMLEGDFSLVPLA